MIAERIAAVTCLAGASMAFGLAARNGSKRWLVPALLFITLAVIVAVSGK